MNKTSASPFFRFEDLRVAAGQVIVEAMALTRTEEDQLGLAVRQHAQMVYCIAYSVLRNHHDAEDPTQEVFIRVLRARRKLSEVEDPRKWIARIAWRVAAGKRKKPVEVHLDEMDQAAIRLYADRNHPERETSAAEVGALLQPSHWGRRRPGPQPCSSVGPVRGVG
jgi:DNA-directed RNA polymerase specialized sigma24 family protein